MTLYVTDDELIERLGVPRDVACDALRVLDHEHRKNRFPQRSPLWGGRRYWPAVKQWLDAHNGLGRKSDAA